MHFNRRWRLIAVVALLLYVCVLFLMVRFILRNALFSMVFLASAALLMYAVWLVFTGEERRGLRGRLYLCISLVLVLAEAIYFVRSVTDLLSIVLFLVLSAAYVAAVGLLQKAYWKSKRAHAQATQGTTHFTKPWLIVNPKSGNGRAIKNNIPELAQKQGIGVTITRKGDDVGDIARTVAGTGVDVLGVSGGDGSLGAVAKVALEYDLPVVVLPGGTRCHFARDIGLDPKRIADALAGFEGVERRIDVGAINGRIFLNNVSFGLYADIVDDPDYRDNKLRVSRKVLKAIVGGEKDGYDLRFKHGGKLFRKAVMVLVGVNKYETFNVFELGVRQKLDEGVLQITSVLKLNDSTYKRMVAVESVGTFLGHKDLEDVEQWEAESFRITSPGKTIVAGVDGEREVYRAPVNVHILPKALRVYVPPEGERGRPEKPFSLKTLGDIWRALKS